MMFYEIERRKVDNPTEHHFPCGVPNSEPLRMLPSTRFFQFDPNAFQDLYKFYNHRANRKTDWQKLQRPIVRDFNDLRGLYYENEDSLEKALDEAIHYFAQKRCGRSGHLSITSWASTDDRYTVSLEFCKMRIVFYMQVDLAAHMDSQEFKDFSKQVEDQIAQDVRGWTNLSANIRRKGKYSPERVLIEIRNKNAYFYLRLGLAEYIIHSRWHRQHVREWCSRYQEHFPPIEFEDQLKFPGQLDSDADTPIDLGEKDED